MLMDELVKYQNDMNRLKFKGFTQTDMNLFVALCSQMKEKGANEVVLSFSKIKQLVKYDEKKRSINEFIQDLERMNEQLMSVNCKIITDSKIIMFVLFPTFEIDKKQETLTVAVNEKFTWLLNEMKTYTIFELAEFIELKSKYSKHLYRILKQWRTVGKYIFHDLQEFREIMDIPVKYTNRQLMQDCVSVAVEEIKKLDKSFKNFKCEPEYAQKRGKPLEKLIFTWTPEIVTTPKKKENQVLEQLQGQESFSDCQTFEEYMKQYKGDDKPTPVELKIARDIAKGNKKKQEEPKKNKFINFEQRKYDFDELEALLLTTNVPH